MLGYKKDLAVTRLLRANGLLLDPRSFVTLGLEPHLKLKGDDMVCQRQRVAHRSKGKCAACKSPIRVFGLEQDWEMDHKQGGLVGRYDDLENLQALCRPCHRKKHVRPKFSKKLAEEDFGKLYPESA